MTWVFELNNGQYGSKEITDALISNEDIARQRANAEFLDGGYRKRFLSMTTFRTDISVGEVVRVRGLCYLVTSVNTKYGGGMLLSDVSAVRYE